MSGSTSHRAVLAAFGLLALAGVTACSQTPRFDPDARGTWQEAAVYNPDAGLGTGTNVVWTNDRYYAISPDLDDVRQFVSYDPATNVWTELSTWQDACGEWIWGGSGMVAEVAGSIYFVPQGDGADDRPLCSYEIGTNTWTQLPAHGVSYRRIAAAGDQLVDWGDEPSVFNPATGTWRDLPDDPVHSFFATEWEHWLAWPWGDKLLFWVQPRNAAPAGSAPALVSYDSRTDRWESLGDAPAAWFPEYLIGDHLVFTGQSAGTLYNVRTRQVEKAAASAEVDATRPGPLGILAPLPGAGLVPVFGQLYSPEAAEWVVVPGLPTDKGCQLSASSDSLLAVCEDEYGGWLFPGKPHAAQTTVYLLRPGAPE